MAELVQFPLMGHAPDNRTIAAHLRGIADTMEQEGALGVMNAILLLEYEDGCLSRYSCGQPIDHARLVGLLTIATNQELNG